MLALLLTHSCFLFLGIHIGGTFRSSGSGLVQSINQILALWSEFSLWSFVKSLTTLARKDQLKDVQVQLLDRYTLPPAI